MICDTTHERMIVRGPLLQVAASQRARLEEGTASIGIKCTWSPAGYGVATYRDDSGVTAPVDHWTLELSDTADAARLQAWLDTNPGQ